MPKNRCRKAATSISKRGCSNKHIILPRNDNIVSQWISFNFQYYIVLKRQHQYFLLFVKLSMSFYNLIKERNTNRQEELNCLNPISKVNLGLRKAGPTQTTSFLPANNQPTNQSYPQQMSFSSLSKHKDQHYSSQVRLRNTENSSSSFSKTSNTKAESKVKEQFKYDNLQRRLFDDSKRFGGSSKENKLNFTNVIKSSKQKSLKKGNMSKWQEQKVIKPPKKEIKHLNTLKNRLIGHKEKEQSAPTASSATRKAALGTDDLQIVRISMQSTLKQSVELDMSPYI